MVYFLCKASDSGRQNCYFALSLPVRGAWVEMEPIGSRERLQRRSLPVRGAWVEIVWSSWNAPHPMRRSPCGERGLKYTHDDGTIVVESRSPCGERGLKYDADVSVSHLVESLPVRGAWVEIICSGGVSAVDGRRSPCGERGLKSAAPAACLSAGGLSLPVRGAWVEIKAGRNCRRAPYVAPRAGSVG